MGIVSPSIESKTATRLQECIPVPKTGGHITHIRQGITANNEVQKAQIRRQSFGIRLHLAIVTYTLGHL